VITRTLLILGMLLSLGGRAQSVSGYWYGTAFISDLQESQHNYLIELILTEKGSKVEGIMNYYFRNVYRSVPITGSIKQRQLILTKIPFLYYGSVTKKEVDCFMDGAFTLVMARAGSTISGKFVPDFAYKYTCPPLQIRLNLDKEQKINDSLRRVIKNASDHMLSWSVPTQKNIQTGIASRSTGTPKNSPSEKIDSEKVAIQKAPDVNRNSIVITENPTSRPTADANPVAPATSRKETSSTVASTTETVKTVPSVPAPNPLRVVQETSPPMGSTPPEKQSKEVTPVSPDSEKAKTAVTERNDPTLLATTEQKKKTSGKISRRKTERRKLIGKEAPTSDQAKRSTRSYERKNKNLSPRVSQTRETAVIKTPSVPELPRPGILEIVQEIELDVDEVMIRLYDNGEVDGDSVSIFMNNKPIKIHQRLTNQPIEFSIPLDSLLEYVEISMVAENLGTIPPNSALMVVEAGTRRYEIRLTSTLEKSATVRFKRKRKGLKFRQSDIK